MRKFTTALGTLLLMAAFSTFADGHKVKVGMITTLSGGVSGLSDQPECVFSKGVDTELQKN